MIVRDDVQETPEWESQPHCCDKRTCWYCRQERPEVPSNIELGGRGD